MGIQPVPGPCGCIGGCKRPGYRGCRHPEWATIGRDTVGVSRAMPRYVAPPKETETAWLIERDGPMYWNGMYSGDNASAWTTDHDQAIRFARESDAALIRHNLMGPPSRAPECRLVEHMWINRDQEGRA